MAEKTSPVRLTELRIPAECNKLELNPKVLKQFRQAFLLDEKNILAMNACSKYDPLEICTQRSVLEKTNHIFTHKVDSECKPMTNQKRSGNCWIYSALNVMRIPFAKHYQLEEFEFSQSYILFWDKVERCNFFLHTVVDLFLKGMPLDDRLVAFLLQNPVADGGQFDMFVNTIAKYGIVPKKCFPEAYSSDTTLRLNQILNSKAREYIRNLHQIVDQQADVEEMDFQQIGLQQISAKQISVQQSLKDNIHSYMEEMYRIIVICLGIPPETFTWEYYNKSKAFRSIGPITPIKFYEEHVKPYCNIETKVCLINDPRTENPFLQSYTVKCLGNMIGGRRVTYVNMDASDLLWYTVESLKNNEAVWFGCDISKRFSNKLGIQDLDLHDYSVVFSTDIQKSLTKAEKLLYGDSMMSHAMIFTGVTLNENDVPTKFRVENTWGDELGEKGYMVMTSDWFEEYVYEVAIDKKYLPKPVLEALEKEPIELPAWDPMGALTL